MVLLAWTRSAKTCSTGATYTWAAACTSLCRTSRRRPRQQQQRCSTTCPPPSPPRCCYCRPLPASRICSSAWPACHTWETCAWAWQRTAGRSSESWPAATAISSSSTHRCCSRHRIRSWVWRLMAPTACSSRSRQTPGCTCAARCHRCCWQGWQPSSGQPSERQQQQQRLRPWLPVPPAACRRSCRRWGRPLGETLLQQHSRLQSLVAWSSRHCMASSPTPAGARLSLVFCMPGRCGRCGTWAASWPRPGAEASNSAPLLSSACWPGNGGCHFSIFAPTGRRPAPQRLAHWDVQADCCAKIEQDSTCIIRASEPSARLCTHACERSFIGSADGILLASAAIG